LVPLAPLVPLASCRQRAPQPAGDAVVQDPVPPVAGHDLRDSDGQRQVGPLLVQRPAICPGSSSVFGPKPGVPAGWTWP
jgi:hypothetical protein